MTTDTRNFESNKILAGVGALLVAIGSFIPVTGAIGILALVGIILFLVGVKGIADNLNDNAIWRSTLNGFIFEAIGIVVGIAAFVSIFVGLFTGIRITYPVSVGIALLIGIILSIVVFVFFILGAIYIRQALQRISSHTGETILSTGGILLLIGAILTIILIGFLLLFIAWLLIAIGFFSMRLTQTQPPPAYQPPPTYPSAGQVRYCTYCGSPNRTDASFCTHCGRKLEPINP